MYEENYPKKRYKLTLDFINKYISKDDVILDLGVDNPLSKLLKLKGYNISNTNGEDLDIDFTSIEKNNADVMCAFQILEHLVSPYNILTRTKAKKLIASVPLRLWFAKAYRNNKDPRDCHYHEFEDWQFDWLLEKAGWKIKARKKWTNPTNKIGFRPILRWFTPRYYIVYAEKK